MLMVYQAYRQAMLPGEWKWTLREDDHSSSREVIIGDVGCGDDCSAKKRRKKAANIKRGEQSDQFSPVAYTGLQLSRLPI